MEKTKNIDLGTAPVGSTFIRYAIPSVLGMLMLSIAGIVDGLFIGRYVGTDALAGVSIVYPITSLAIGFAIMIGTGGTTTAAAEIGAGNLKSARNTFTVTMVLVTVLALLFTVFGLIFINPISIYFGSKGGLNDEIKIYLIPLLFFFIPFMHAWILDVFIRNDGKPVFPSVILVLSSLTNIVLDYLFVARFSWGLRGAAIATGASQILPTLVFWVYIHMDKSSYRLVKPVFRTRKIYRMLFNGASEFINEFSVGLGAIIFNMVLISRIGSIGVASYSIIQYVTMITIMVFFGIAQASQPGLSFNLGAGNLKRIKSFKYIALWTNIIFSLIAFSVLLFFNRIIASVFTKGDRQVMELTASIARYYSWAYLPMALNITFSMYFTSIHYAAESAITAVLRSLVLFLLFLFTLPPIIGNIGLWMTVPAAEAVTFVVVLILLVRRPVNREYLDNTIAHLKEN